MTVKTICILKEEKNFRLEKVMVSVFSERAEEMTAFILKVNGQETHLQNFGQYQDRHLNQFMAKIKPDLEKQGYYCLYAGKDWETCYETDRNPLIEFETPLREIENGFTSIGYNGRSFWTFCGNHSEYSGAFYYVIWDQKLATEIRDRLHAEECKIKKELEKKK